MISLMYVTITTGLESMGHVIADAAVFVSNAVTTNDMYIKISSNRCVSATCEAIASNPTVVYLRSSAVYTYQEMRQKHVNEKIMARRVVSFCWYFGIFCGMSGVM